MRYSKPFARISTVAILAASGLSGLLCNGQGFSPSDAALARRINSSPKIPLIETRLALQLPFGWNLGSVSGVAAAKDGSIYVIQRNLETDPILVFNCQGTLLRSWGKGDFKLPHSLRVDTAGNVWALDAEASRVIKYSSAGQKLMTINIRPVAETGNPFRGITDIAFEPDGHLLIADGYANARILEYTSSGKLIRIWGTPGAGPGEFHLPHAIQVGPLNVVYVADRENGRVEVFTQKGKLLRQFRGLGRCNALELHNGVLWATIAPRDQPPGAPGWLITMDPATGRILGHLYIPDQLSGHALSVKSTDEPLTTSGSTLLLFHHLR